MTIDSDFSGSIRLWAVKETPIGVVSRQAKICGCPSSTGQPIIPGLMGTPVCSPSAAANRPICSQTLLPATSTAADASRDVEFTRIIYFTGTEKTVIMAVATIPAMAEPVLLEPIIQSFGKDLLVY